MMIFKRCCLKWNTVGWNHKISLNTFWSAIAWLSVRNSCNKNLVNSWPMTATSMLTLGYNYSNLMDVRIAYLKNAGALNSLIQTSECNCSCSMYVRDASKKWRHLVFLILMLRYSNTSSILMLHFPTNIKTFWLLLALPIDWCFCRLKRKKKLLSFLRFSFLFFLNESS